MAFGFAESPANFGFLTRTCQTGKITSEEIIDFSFGKRGVALRQTRQVPGISCRQRLPA